MRPKALGKAIARYWSAHKTDIMALQRKSWGVCWMGEVAGAPGCWAGKFINGVEYSRFFTSRRAMYAWFRAGRSNAS